jgi:hypothetical protein
VGKGYKIHFVGYLELPSGTTTIGDSYHWDNICNLDAISNGDTMEMNWIPSATWIALEMYVEHAVSMKRLKLEHLIKYLKNTYTTCTNLTKSACRVVEY